MRNANMVTAAGTTLDLSATLTRTANATQYSVGDNIGPGPLVWTWDDIFSGRLIGARMTVTAASGTIVLPAIDLLVFRPISDVPFATGSYPADNAAITLTAAAMKDCIGIISFSEASWRNNVGGSSAAGGFCWQSAAVAAVGSRPFATFVLPSSPTLFGLRGLLIAQNTWNPGNVAQTIDVTLDADFD